MSPPEIRSMLPNSYLLHHCDLKCLHIVMIDLLMYEYDTVSYVLCYVSVGPLTCYGRDRENSLQ